jgi:hypothetical protein
VLRLSCTTGSAILGCSPSLRRRLLSRILRLSAWRSGRMNPAGRGERELTATPGRQPQARAARRRATEDQERRVGAALAVTEELHAKQQEAARQEAERAARKPPPTRSGAACSGKRSNSPSSSPDARPGRKTALMPSADFGSAIGVTASRRSQSLPAGCKGVAGCARF